MANLRLGILILIFMVVGRPALAARGGGGSGVSSLPGEGSVGLYGGIVNTTQGDLNTLQQRANVNQGGITTSSLTQAWEVGGFYQYRFLGTIYALHIRPSYFYERQDGSGPGGSYTYGVTGWTLFPMLRLYPLENEFMKFYMQFGLGYGSATGMISEGPGNDVKFNSGAFGTQFGMGAEFCFTGTQCMAFEGNYRYLSFERNVVSSSNGTFNTSKGSLSQYGKGQELELDGNDVSVRMSGLMFMAGYIYYF